MFGLLEWDELQTPHIIPNDGHMINLLLYLVHAKHVNGYDFVVIWYFSKGTLLHCL